jgi:hypothetical protein
MTQKKQQPLKKKNSEAELEQIGCIRVIYKRYLKSPWPDVSYEENHAPHNISYYADQRILPRPARTNIFIWCTALICSVVVIAIILAGLAVLICYLLFHPKLPTLNITEAILNRIVLDPSTRLLNAEMVALLRFNNPNDRVDVRYEYINFKLFFRNDMIATQVLEPFAQRRGDWSLRAIDMVSNHAELTPLSAEIMVSQALNNTISYELFGTLRTVAKLGGIASIPYWLYVDCQLEFSTPPNGIFRYHKCTSRL